MAKRSIRLKKRSKCCLDELNFWGITRWKTETFWLSEVFSDVSEILQSRKFVQALCTRLERVTRETYDQKSFKSEHMQKWVDYDEYVRSVGMEIDYAEGALNEP